MTQISLNQKTKTKYTGKAKGYLLQVWLDLGAYTGTFLVVKRLRLHAYNAGGTCLILALGTKIPYAVWHSQKKKKKVLKQCCEGMDSSTSLSL